MSCPHFDPQRPNPRAGTMDLPYLPLGGAWTGTCHADAANPVQPAESELLSLCNLGYARGVCPRFPATDPGPDAARFTIAQDDGACLRLYYVLERNHEPFAHGLLECPLPPGPFTVAPVGKLTEKQARAYASSYLTRKASAANA